MSYWSLSMVQRVLEDVYGGRWELKYFRLARLPQQLVQISHNGVTAVFFDWLRGPSIPWQIVDAARLMLPLSEREDLWQAECWLWLVRS